MLASAKNICVSVALVVVSLFGVAGNFFGEPSEPADDSSVSATKSSGNRDNRLGLLVTQAGNLVRAAGLDPALVGSADDTVDEAGTASAADVSPRRTSRRAIGRP